MPIDIIVADFFQWPLQGEYSFDPDYWPDPAAMVAELESMGIKLMVSIWPTIDRNSSPFAEMREKGLLVRTERGVITTMEFLGDTVFYDPTNPKAREYEERFLIGSFRIVGSAEASGERTRPRVHFPASRRKTLFGETPNTTRGDAYAPQI